LRIGKFLAGAAAVGVVSAAAIAAGLTTAGADSSGPPTTTPIKHVVVLYQENISFDHYFGTYPHATNPTGESPFTPLPGTPSVNGLSATLLNNNPNAANPQRIDPQSDLLNIIGCDNNHNYSPEQKAFDGGLMDQFVANTTGGAPCSGNEALNYFDGNTVTAMWNYAQHFSMSDNSYGTGFGPSTPGAFETVSGNTTGIVDDAGNPIASQGTSVDNNTAYSNANPFLDFDGCSPGGTAYAASFATSGASQHKNVGDLMNTAGVTWGWFQGGFTPTSRLAPSATFPVGQPVCAAAHNNIAHASQQDYDAHHNPFAYYKSTANPQHLPPSSAAMVGHTDVANHQYDLTDFNTAVATDNLPAVSFVKAGHYQDGHAGYSDPIDEQKYLVDEINAIEASPSWSSTAIIIGYDDSDGWYDHQAPPIVRNSITAEDFLNGAGHCGTTNTGTQVVSGPNRCGFGPRLPLIVISPYAKRNFVDGTLTDQTSVLKFIEDNWSLGRIGGNSLDTQAGSLMNMFDFDPNHTQSPALTLDDTTGAVVGDDPTPAGPPGPAGPAGPAGPTGSAGSDGSTGPAGAAGATGSTGPGGPQGGSGANGANGTNGSNGPAGAPGAKGDKGDTGPAGPAIVCSGKVVSKKVVVTCKTAKVTTTRAAVRIRLVRGSKILATSRALIRGRQARLVLSPKQLRHGRYTLRVTLTSAGKVSGHSQALSL
jgi:phospholipase C